MSLTFSSFFHYTNDIRARWSLSSAGRRRKPPGPRPQHHRCHHAVNTVTSGQRRSHGYRKTSCQYLRVPLEDVIRFNWHLSLWSSSSLTAFNTNPALISTGASCLSGFSGFFLLIHNLHECNFCRPLAHSQNENQIQDSGYFIVIGQHFVDDKQLKQFCMLTLSIMY